MTTQTRKKTLTPFMKTAPMNWKNHNQIIKALESSGYHIGFMANRVIRSIDLKAEKSPQELVKANTLKLGFKNNYPYEKIVQKITSLGSSLCHLSIGPEVRLAHREQNDEILVIATLPYQENCKQEENCSLFVIKDCSDYRLSIFATPIVTINKFDPAKTFWVFPEPTS